MINPFHRRSPQLNEKKPSETTCDKKKRKRILQGQHFVGWRYPSSVLLGCSRFPPDLSFFFRLLQASETSNSKEEESGQESDDTDESGDDSNSASSNNEEEEEQGEGGGKCNICLGQSSKNDQILVLSKTVFPRFANLFCSSKQFQLGSSLRRAFSMRHAAPGPTTG